MKLLFLLYEVGYFAKEVVVGQMCGLGFMWPMLRYRQKGRRFSRWDCGGAVRSEVRNVVGEGRGRCGDGGCFACHCCLCN